MARNIYNYAKEKVLKGSSWHVDWQRKSFRIGKEFLIKDGEIVNPKDTIGITPEGDLLQVIDELEERFWATQHCVKGRKVHDSVFPQPKNENLSPEDELFGDYYQSFFELEFSLFAYIMQGVFTPWDTEVLGDGYFWKSKVYPKFVIYRSWTEFNN